MKPLAIIIGGAALLFVIIEWRKSQQEVAPFASSSVASNATGPGKAINPPAKIFCYCELNNA